MLISKLLSEALSDSDWRTELIKDAHQHADEMRKAKGLKPYDWGELNRRSEMQVSEDYKRIMLKYKYIVDVVTVQYDGMKHEELKVEDVSIYAPKRICIKCGGPRHQLDTRGFCPMCKAELGMPTSPKQLRQYNQERNWDSKRTEIATASGVVSVSADLINFAWNAMSEESKQSVMLSIWRALPLDQKAHYIERECKVKTNGNGVCTITVGGGAV